MAEEPTSGLQNWKLLVIALVLAVVAAIVYNFHIHQISEAAKGTLKRLLVYNKDLQLGEKITLQDLDDVLVDTQYLDRFNPIVEPKDKDSVLGSPVSQSVLKNHFVLWGDVRPDTKDSPSSKIPEGMVAHTIDINPQMTPGNMLRVGDRVNVYALLPDAKGKVGPLTIIEGVQVLAIGGRTVSDRPAAGRSDDGSASYRSLTLALPKNVSLKLVNVLTHRSGDPWVDLCRPGEGRTESGMRSEQIDVTKEVTHLATVPAVLAAPPG
jgi:Flp pilus assembly protein CpaB